MNEHEMIKFVVWYSGMKSEQVKKAYQKYKMEQIENEKSGCCNSNLYYNSSQKFCSKCNECLGSID